MIQDPEHTVIQSQTPPSEPAFLQFFRGVLVFYSCESGLVRMVADRLPSQPGLLPRVW